MDPLQIVVIVVVSIGVLFAILAIARIGSYLIGIRKYKQLLKEDKITEAEFKRIKDKLLNHI